MTMAWHSNYEQFEALLFCGCCCCSSISIYNYMHYTHTQTHRSLFELTERQDGTLKHDLWFGLLSFVSFVFCVSTRYVCTSLILRPHPSHFSLTQIVHSASSGRFSRIHLIYLKYFKQKQQQHIRKTIHLLQQKHKYIHTLKTKLKQAAFYKHITNPAI